MPDVKHVWQFFLKFTERGYYNKTPSDFLFHLLKLQMPEFFDLPLTAREGPTITIEELEGFVRKYIKGDKRIRGKLVVSMDVVLVSLLYCTSILVQTIGDCMTLTYSC